MRVFILPSWCPTQDQPLSGTFFVEQAEAIARLRPNWEIAFCSFDLSSSRVPWKINRIPRFLKDCFLKPRLNLTLTNSGLKKYEVWSAYFPRLGRVHKWEANTAVLAEQVRPALAHFIKNFGKPDLIHARAVYPGGAAAVKLGQEFEIPVGITEHIGPFPGKQLSTEDGSPFSFISHAYRDAAKHSADGTKLAKRLEELGLSSEVDIIPNFLKDDFGSKQTRPDKRNDLFTFLSIGGPSYAKGTDILLKAFSTLKIPSQLMIVGESSEALIFHKLADELGVKSRVFWLGAVAREELPIHLEACDAFVLPSRGENFGVVFIEALAYGKPLIATRCGGPEDIIHEGNGLLVQVNDTENLSKAMDFMLENASNYDPDELRKDFLLRFSASAVVDQIDAWYQAVCSNQQSKIYNAR